MVVMGNSLKRGHEFLIREAIDDIITIRATVGKDFAKQDMESTPLKEAN